MIWIDNMLFMAQIETIIHLHYIQTGAGTPHVVPQLPICTKRPLRPPPDIHSPSYEAVWVKCRCQETGIERDSNHQPFSY